MTYAQRSWSETQLGAGVLAPPRPGPLPGAGLTSLSLSVMFLFPRAFHGAHPVIHRRKDPAICSGSSFLPMRCRFPANKSCAHWANCLVSITLVSRFVLYVC